MKKIINVLFILLVILVFNACTSTKRLSFSCNDPTIDIYIDGEFAGRNLVNYVFPNGKRDVDVTCIDNGSEVYHRVFYRDGHINNELIDLPIQKDFHY